MTTTKTTWVRQPYVSLGLLWLALLLIFIADRFTPLGFAHGILYMPVMMAAMLTRPNDRNFKRAVFAAALLGTAFGYVISPNAHSLPTIFIVSNRLLTAIILIITYVYLNKLHHVRLQHAEIQQLEVFQRRTMMEYANALPIQVWTANARGDIDFVSNRLADFAGRTREDIMANWLTVLHPDDRKRAAAAWEQAIESATPYYIESRIQRRDGDYVWFQTQAVPQRDADGVVLRWLGSSIDVDDLRRLREESEHLAEQYRNTVESITDAFFTLDHDFRFTYVNPNAAEVLGAHVNDILGQIIWDVCQSGSRCPFAEKFREAAHSQEKLHFEAYLATSEKWLEVSVYPSSSGLTVHFDDVTELRKEREQLKLLNTAVSRLNDIIIITEADPLDEPGPKTVFVNPAFEKLTGYAMHETLGKSPRILQGPKTNTEALKRIRSALQNQQPIRTELLNYTKTGEEYWLEIEIIPIVDNKGKCTHFVAVERDITERIDMENQLRESQKLEVVGRLTGGVAHDFNNLLTVILSNMEMLSEQLDDPEQLSMTEMTMTAAKRGAELTNRLLSFARRQPLDPKVININQLIDSMLALYRRTLPENIDLVFAPSKHIGTIEIDATELDTALLNLVVNARDAMPDGGTITLETASRTLDKDYADHHAGVAPGDYVMISVSDNGIGMTETVREKVFEPFFTTKAIGTGSGLGLSMVFGFTKQSGGHIRLYSEPGEGTVVKLYFPIVTDDQPALPTEAVHQPIQGGQEHILVAEDDELVLHHLEKQLTALGYRVTVAMSGPEALLALSIHNDVDLLLTDIIMPGGINGRELAEQAWAVNPALKVLFSSGYTGQTIVQDGRLEAGTALLNKPYTRQELADKVRRVLDQPAAATRH